MRTVGYQEIVEIIESGGDRIAAIDAIKAHTRQYSRRQMTWFKRWPFVEWLKMDELSLDDACSLILSRLRDLEILPK